MMQLVPLASIPVAAKRSEARPRRWLFRLFSAFGCWTLTGCALLQPRGDSTRFYVLTAPNVSMDRPGESEFRRWKVGLRPVEVPAYLRSKAMVVRTGHNEIQFADFDRWAEPLEQGISRVMKETLSSVPNVAGVTLNSHGEDTLDYEVTVRILACEGGRATNGPSSIRFAATWEVRSVGSRSPLTKHGRFTPDPLAWDGQSYGQLAERLSEVIAALSKTVVANLPREAKVLLQTDDPRRALVSNRVLASHPTLNLTKNQL